MNIFPVWVRASRQQEARALLVPSAGSPGQGRRAFVVLNVRVRPPRQQGSNCGGIPPQYGGQQCPVELLVVEKASRYQRQG